VPDLGVTCAPPGNDMIVPDPVLLIEILSPSNTAETWNNIWAYTTIPSVQEIVAIHTVRIEAELLIRGPGAAWPETAEIIGPDGVLTLPSIGFSVPLRAVYRTTSLA
jgi:Uma2 family endonuclease